MDAFKKIWDSSWGPRLENLLRNTLFLLMDQPSATLVDIRRVLFEESFRNAALTRVSNPQVKEFWTKEFAPMPPHMRREAIAPIMNKVNAFLTDQLLQNILTRKTGQIDGFSGANTYSKLMGAAQRGLTPAASATECEIAQLYQAGRLTRLTRRGQLKISG